MKRVAVTGMSGISPLGNSHDAVMRKLRSLGNAIQHMADWDDYEGLNTRLAAPAVEIDFPRERFNRKSMRSMGRVAALACRATELALEDAGLRGDPILQGGRVGVAYGSSAGTPTAMADFTRLFANRSTEGVNANSYLRMMAHTAPVNLSVFFGLTGRVLTTSSACTSGSQGIGYAYEAVKHGHAVAMVAGGAEELCVSQAVVFDTLFATSTRNDAPHTTPRPFDTERDGLVIGEGACTLILEDLDHALARGAHVYAEIVGFGTNCDGRHVTQPNADTMAQAMRLALDDAGLAPSVIGYINAHGTATDQGDVAESQATASVFGSGVPVSSLKSYMGHTLGACGALEAWMSILMQAEGWFAPTLNLQHVDPRCGELDYIRDQGRAIDCEYTISNNFAFGGINTALVLRRATR